MTKKEFNKLDLCETCKHNNKNYVQCFEVIKAYLFDEKEVCCMCKHSIKKCLKYEKEKENVTYD